MSLREPKVLRLLLTVGIAALALWGYFLSDLLPFGYQRQTRKEKQLRSAQETLATELEKARRTVSALPQLEREQQDLEQKWKQAEALLPTAKEMPELLTQVTQAGEQAGVTFELFKPGAQRPQEFYNENPVEIQVAGGFHQVGVFLARVANLTRIVNVTGLTLEGAKQKSRTKGKREKAAEDAERTDHTLVASFTATAYSLRDPSDPMPAPPAERGGRKVAAKGGEPASTAAASTTGSKGTAGALTKRLSDKAKAKPAATEGEAH